MEKNVCDAKIQGYNQATAAKKRLGYTELVLQKRFAIKSVRVTKFVDTSSLGQKKARDVI